MPEYSYQITDVDIHHNYDYMKDHRQYICRVYTVTLPKVNFGPVTDSEMLGPAIFEKEVHQFSVILSSEIMLAAYDPQQIIAHAIRTHCMELPIDSYSQEEAFVKLMKIIVTNGDKPYFMNSGPQPTPGYEYKNSYEYLFDSTNKSKEPTIALLSTQLPGVLSIVNYPCECYPPGSTHVRTARVWDIIQHLNDTDKWSRDMIADWTETLDIDMSFE